MTTQTSTVIILGNCAFELLLDGGQFRGLGEIRIGKTRVRSGRLPLRPSTQTFTGLELAGLQFLDLVAGDEEVRICLQATFAPLSVKLMRDHSFDPIHELGDWDTPRQAGSGRLDLVLRPARDAFNGVEFAGFSYHYEYESEAVPLFYLLDMASWELDGDITGGTAYSQSSCSDPVVTFADDTAWTTEGILFFLVEAGNQNPVMTHNLPRWASHGSFDFQFKGDTTLVGTFERVELIRSVLCREAGKAELKTFDKHIFDQALAYATSAKSILLNRDAKTVTNQQNLWTWISDEVDRRARAEFGIRDEPIIPTLSQNYWEDFTVETYYQDLLPAAVETGTRRIFVDNLKKTAMSEDAPLAGVFHWNMCCGHEYEIAAKVGGVERVKAFVGDCKQHGIQVQLWTNNTQALSSPLNQSERDEQGWYVKLEDARLKYGGAYAGVMSVLDLANPEVRRHFLDAHVRIKEQTGIDALFFDSFYNLGFMPVSYRDCAPRTIWRGCLELVRDLQQAGFNVGMESFGPFAQPRHGHPSSYNMDTIFICYRVGLGNDYSTVPCDNPLFKGHPDGPMADFYCLAHKAGMVSDALFKDGQRADHRWTTEQRRTLAVYHERLPAMSIRYLQEDGQAVLWHDEGCTQATLWNFTDRELPLPGAVVDVTTNTPLPAADRYLLAAGHVYTISGTELPVTL